MMMLEVKSMNEEAVEKYNHIIDVYFHEQFNYTMYCKPMLDLTILVLSMETFWMKYLKNSVQGIAKESNNETDTNVNVGTFDPK